MFPTSAALVIAHPGHELRVHRWLELAAPRVFVITDGSGGGMSRIDATVRLIERSGATPGTVLGAFTDREIYALMLSGDVAPVLALVLELSESFLEHDLRAVVADALEWYNPTHDLCAVMASLAAQRASRIGGHPISLYDYAVTEKPAAAGEILTLDDEAFDRKLAAAHSCEVLKNEVDGLIARIGIDALRTEVLRPLTDRPELRTPPSKPFYETHGEQRVATGRYGSVIRWEQHLRPFAEELSAAVSAAAVDSQRAWVS